MVSDEPPRPAHKSKIQQLADRRVAILLCENGIATPFADADIRVPAVCAARDTGLDHRGSRKRFGEIRRQNTRLADAGRLKDYCLSRRGGVRDVHKLFPVIQVTVFENVGKPRNFIEKFRFLELKHPLTNRHIVITSL